MLDIIRTVSAVIAIVSATRLRFAFGVVFGDAVEEHKEHDQAADAAPNQDRLVRPRHERSRR